MMVSFSITCNCRSRGEVSLFYSRLRIQSRYLVLRPSMMILSRSFFLSNHFSPLALIFFILIVHVFNLIFMCALIILKKKNMHLLIYAIIFLRLRAWRPRISSYFIQLYILYFLFNNCLLNRGRNSLLLFYILISTKYSAFKKSNFSTISNFWILWMKFCKCNQCAIESRFFIQICTKYVCICISF